MVFTKVLYSIIPENREIIRESPDKELGKCTTWVYSLVRDEEGVMAAVGGGRGGGRRRRWRRRLTHRAAVVAAVHRAAKVKRKIGFIANIPHEE